jgi:hypothetical protein
VVENLVVPVSFFANSAGSSSVTQPVSTAFIKIPDFANSPAVCKHIQGSFSHISVDDALKSDEISLP